MSVRDAQVGDGVRWLPLGMLCLIYVGLLAGDQALPGVDPDLRVPQVRHLVVLTAYALLPGLLFTPPLRSGRAATRFMAGLVLFLAYTALTSMWSPVGAAPGELLGDLALMAAYVLVAVICAARMSDPSWRWFWYAVLASSLVFGLGGLAAGGIGEGRMSAFGAGPNVFVRIVGTGAVIGAYIAYRSGRLAWLLPTALLTGVSVLSGSRGGTIALAISLLVSIVIGYRWLRRSRRVVAMVSGAAFVGVGLYAALGEQILSVVHTRFGEQLIERGQTAGREELYEGAFELWQASPLVGNGIGAFAVESGSVNSYTHNMVLDVLVDGGLLGLGLLGVALLAAGPGIWRAVESHDVALAATLALFYLVASQFSGTYYDTRMLWFFLGLSAVAAAPRLLAPRSRKEGILVR